MTPHIDSLPTMECQEFEKFPELTSSIQQLVTHGKIISGREWDAFLKELNKVCKLASFPSPRSSGRLEFAQVQELKDRLRKIENLVKVSASCNESIAKRVANFFDELNEL